MKKNRIWKLSGIPMPPSLNEAFANHRRMGRIKSASYRNWQVDFDKFVLANSGAFAAARDLLFGHNDRNMYALNLEFMFPRSSILTKKNTAKRLDISNRVKLIEDALSKQWDTDDKNFWEIRLTKNAWDFDFKAVNVELFIFDDDFGD